MMRQRTVEIYVGFFILIGILALIFLAFKVSGLSEQAFAKNYSITADFTTIGGLKVRAPVKIGGVTIGEVKKITLNTQTFQAVVIMAIDAKNSDLPDDSSASIYTEGLLGSNYISVNPGYSTSFLKQGSVIGDTHSALVLENLIGQFLFNIKK
jgi:phospholipid/cholesterol/gamma-HCH transport system substrate-binding protein